MATNIVLGISLGTRYVGIALLRNGFLTDCRIKPFLSSWSKDKETEILDYLEKYLITNGIQTIAQKFSNPDRSSPQLLDLERGFLKIIDEYQIKIFSYTISDIKELCQNSKNHHELSDFLSERYPYLYTAYNKERKQRKEYYKRMFEAVAAAHLASREM